MSYQDSFFNNALTETHQRSHFEDLSGLHQSITWHIMLMCQKRKEALTLFYQKEMFTFLLEGYEIRAEQVTFQNNKKGAGLT